jgi:hypothetical protein
LAGLEYGALWYRSTEMLLGETAWGTAVDMWAAGCIHSEMLTGVPLFNEKTQYGMVLMHLRYLGHPQEAALHYMEQLPLWSRQYPVFEGARRQCPNENCVTVKDSILHHGLLEFDPRERFTARIALQELLDTSKLPPTIVPKASPASPAGPLDELAGRAAAASPDRARKDQYVPASGQEGDEEGGEEGAAEDCRPMSFAARAVAGAAPPRVAPIREVALNGTGGQVASPARSRGCLRRAGVSNTREQQQQQRQLATAA